MDKLEKRWRDFREWVEASVDLENSRMKDRLRDGDDRKESEQRGYRRAMEDTLGMVYAFDREAQKND